MPGPSFFDIVLTNGNMDHERGLFSLRESYPLALCVTSSVRRGFEESDESRGASR